MSEYPQRYQLKLLSESENLELVREFITKIVLKAGFNADDVNKIELALDEACANVVKHAYPKDSALKQLSIVAEIDYKAFTIIVTDQGKGFDTAQIKSLDIGQYVAEMKIGGLGIYLMKNLMDEVEFHIEPGKRNEVKLVKYFYNNEGNLQKNTPKQDAPQGSILPE